MKNFLKYLAKVIFELIIIATIAGIILYFWLEKHG